MFAARLLSVAPAYSPKPSRRKNHRRTNPGLAITGLLFCLLISLPTLTMAEDVAPDATPTVKETPTASAENVTPKVDDSEKQKGRVARAIFTSAIVDREPVDNLTAVSGGAQRVFFFTDLRELAGQIVTHRWEYNGKVMAEVTFKVGNGARWRVYSSKNLLPEWTGQWTVVVSNESGWPLDTSIFDYSAETADKTMTEATETVSP